MLKTLKLSVLIALRNWTVYKKDFIANTSPTVADPALIMISLGLGLGSYLTQLDGKSYLEFLAPGLVIATILFTSFFESSYGFYVRMTYENVFEAMLTTPIGVKEIFIGELLWVGLKGAGMAFGVSLVLLLFGFVANPWNLLTVGLLGFFTALPCGAIGLLSSACIRNLNQFQTVYSFIIAPMYFLSGIFFPLQHMPPIGRALISLFPLVHAVPIAQVLFWREASVNLNIFLSGVFLFIQTIVYCLAAYIGVRRRLIS